MRLTDDKLITPALLKRFMTEGEFEGRDGRHYAVIEVENGNLQTFHPYSPNLNPIQFVWAGNMLKLLNRELHHDGAWVLVFTDPKPTPSQCVLHAPTHCDYDRYVFLWLDQDGDVRFPLEWSKGEAGDLHDFAAVYDAGPIWQASHCEEAWQMWEETQQALDLQAGQTFKRALGERAPSVH